MWEARCIRYIIRDPVLAERRARLRRAEPFAVEEGFGKPLRVRFLPPLIVMRANKGSSR